MRRSLSEPKPARLVLALTWQPANGSMTADGALAAAAEVFGAVESHTPAFAFNHTDYYEQEMGSGLVKCFAEIAGLHGRGSLPDFRQRAGVLEDRHLVGAKRVLNVDPILVSLENVVIATSKGFPHRVYLRDGVYGDLAFIRRRSGFEGLPWTYPDYRENISYFEQVFQRLRTLVTNSR